MFDPRYFSNTPWFSALLFFLIYLTLYTAVKLCILKYKSIITLHLLNYSNKILLQEQTFKNYEIKHLLGSYTKERKLVKLIIIQQCQLIIRMLNNIETKILVIELADSREGLK